MTATVATAWLWLVGAMPGFAQEAFHNLSAQVVPLGGDRYRINAGWTTYDHPFGARAELHEVGDSGDTLTLEPALVRSGMASGATVWRWHASLDVEVPDQVAQVELRWGQQQVDVPIRRTEAQQTTAAVLEAAIAHGDPIAFMYDGRLFVGRPQQIYRVAGDTNGQILQCKLRSAYGNYYDQSFHIARISQIEVNPPARRKPIVP